MNEIDQTVERIGQLVPLVSSLEHWKDNGEPDRGGANGTYETATKEYFGEFCTPDQIAGLQALANAYTQLKADLATAKQGLERIANPINAMQNDLKEGQSLDGVAAVYISNDATWLKSVAQQTLDALEEK